MAELYDNNYDYKYVLSETLIYVKFSAIVLVKLKIERKVPESSQLNKYAFSRFTLANHQL